MSQFAELLEKDIQELERVCMCGGEIQAWERVKMIARRSIREEVPADAYDKAWHILDWLCDQKYQGEELMHAIICCDFVSKNNLASSLARKFFVPQMEVEATTDNA